MQKLFSIKNLFSSQEKKRLVSNFFSLSILQVANYLFPLITLPYLVRVLGPSQYGLVAFAQAFIGYFQILTNYGFNLSATREISINRENPEKVSEIFSSVITIQILLAILSFIMMALVVFSFAKFRDDWLLYFLTFGLVLGNVLFPVWFFQGIERMKYITLLNVLARFIFTIAIFVFIREESDYIYVPLINSVGLVLSGIIGLWIIFNRLGVKFIMPDVNSIKYHLNEGWHIFIGTVGISFYKNNSVLILGLFADSTIVGYFYISKKIIDILNQIAGLISQTFFPYINRLINQNYNLAIVYLKKIGLIIFLYTLVFGLLLLFLSPVIIKIISGHYYNESILSLKLMAFVPMFIGINVPAVHILLSKGFGKEFSNTVLIGAFLDLILNFSLVPFLSFLGSCISVIVVELFVTLYLYFKVLKLKSC
ncbi:polysaccharide transporter, PST family [Thermodesulfobium acidiphilum]|uniref:Polysaccharide transporter, PST family n=1 Tax=Thermodesulfobium acidiphilum TaxID=1794699 RepID=A0A2R4W0M4_THEAF|nr:flippase [Thermodesulfobium acidiphilum]AWB10357.1 polysaccharide transporter, PST family [Thermodesulfobium acidiphilum]